MLIAEILGSFFFGSAISRIFSDYLVFKKGVNFLNSAFSQSIPGFSANLATQKTYDTIYVFSTLALGILIFLINLLLVRQKRSDNFGTISLIYLIYSILLFFENHFVSYSGTRSLAIFLFIEVLYIISSKTDFKNSFKDFYTIANGLFLGFYLFILTNGLTTSLTIPLGFLICTPLLFSLANKNNSLGNPSFLLLTFAAFFPFNRVLILGVGAAFLILNYVQKKKSFLLNFKFKSQIYKVLVLLIVIYNPLFYLGSFDSVEEGFWLGWLERMIKGQNIYSDFAAYHPPLILWGLSLFSKLFGYSMYNLRLYLHILQLTGIVVIYFCSELLIKKTWIRILTLWLILSLMVRNVQNNAEIRLGLGLLSTIPIYFYFSRKNPRFLFLSGILTALSIFSSLEVGVVALVTNFLSVLFIAGKPPGNKLKEEFKFIGGVIIGASPVFLSLVFNNSIKDFISQMLFYAKAFSAGYLNSAVEWPEKLTLLQWFVVNKFFNTGTLLWYITLAGILTSAMYFLFKLKTHNLDDTGKYAGVITLFSVLMLRPVLGRSDGYHLLLLIPMSLILLTYTLEKIFEKNTPVVYFTIILMGLFFMRDQTQAGFMQNQVIKFQTYGNAEGTYPSYKSGRTGILTGIEINTAGYDNFISFLKTNTSDNDSIFVYPWSPEIYFLTDRKNATSYDTPLAFFTENYQKNMIEEIENNKPKYIVYQPKMNLGGLNVGTLPLVNNYIKNNFVSEETFGEYQVLIKSPKTPQ